MDLLGLANLFVSAISAASTVVQAHSSRKVNATAISSAQKRIDEPLKQGGAKLVPVIDKTLLEVLTNKALKETQELINNIRNQDDPDIVQSHISVANSRVCFYLNQIRKHNKNELPTERLKKLWSSNACESCLK
jgi:hypothetical protein